MSCLNCEIYLERLACEPFTVGNTEGATDIDIWIKNHTTGYLHKQELTTDVDGNISVDNTIPSVGFYNAHSVYELWITLRGETKRVDFIESDTGDAVQCLNLKFLTSDDD